MTRPYWYLPNVTHAEDLAAVDVSHAPVLAQVAGPGEERRLPKTAAPGVRVIGLVNSLGIGIRALEVQTFAEIPVKRYLQRVVVRIEESLKLEGACRATPLGAQRCLLIDIGSIEVLDAPTVGLRIAYVADAKKHIARQRP